jgi:hypothetical protein
MSLVGYVLDTIEAEWPDGPFPSDTQRINIDESDVLTTNARQRAKCLTESNYIGAFLDRMDSMPGGVPAGEEREAVIRVTVDGLHSDQGGYIDSEDDYRTLVRNTKEALRTVKYGPNVGDAHPTTWVQLRVSGETSTSAANGDYFQTVFDVTLRGHE